MEQVPPSTWNLTYAVLREVLPVLQTLQAERPDDRLAEQIEHLARLLAFHTPILVQESPIAGPPEAD